MPLRALRDTYAVEDVYGVPIRRLVAAGDAVPAAWVPEDNADVEDIEDLESKQAKPKRRAHKSADDS